MVKKILKWTGIILLVLIIALIAAPFIFKGKIKSMVAKAINEQVDATVSFEDVSLSLFSDFPMASVTVDKLSIINKAPFEGDTLVYMGQIDLSMSIKELFKGEGEPISVKYIHTKDGIVNILFNKDGIGNFDIALKNNETEDDTTETSESTPFALNMQDYSVENLRFRYFDESSKINMVIDSLYHEGHGNFEQSKLDLDTKTSAKLTMDMDKTNYMRNVSLKLDAVLGLDLENSIYTFKENKALINQLPLEFDGSVAMIEEGQKIDLTFKTPTSSFKNFLGLIPEAYSGSLESVKTEGDFTIDGEVNGLYSETTVPKFNIAIASNNASFQYPDLPKSVQNIVIDTKIVNETGLLNDTYVNLDKLSFRIDQDVFDAKATVRNIVENALVNAELKGTINLGNLGKAYPIEMDVPLSGILKADVATKFDMKAVENSQYEKIDNRGSLSLSGFTYSGDGLPKPIEITQASMQFNPSRVTLSAFNAKTGQSDIAITGTLNNFYGFMFKDQTLQGNFNMNSNQLLVADFMAPEPVATAKTEGSKEESKEGEAAKPTATTTSEAVKIPAFLDCTITAKANTVVYDNLNMKNVSGKMIIKDEAVTLENLKTNMFEGLITANGNISTKGAVPTFKMNLDLNKVDIPQTFTQLEMLKSIAPIAGVITGKLNTTINVAGNLDSKEMTPDLNSLTGGLDGQLFNTAVKAENSKVLSTLSQNVKFLDMSKLKLDNLKANLTFENGKVNIKPINLNYQDIPIQVSGQHGFDQSMNYDVVLDVPAKYLGSEVTKLIGSLNDTDASKISVPVNAVITGNFTNPKVSTDLSKSVTNLTKQLVAQQKDKLINQGKDKIKDMLGLGSNNSDSTKAPVPTTTEEAKEQAKEKVEETKEKAKDKAKDIIGGFLNKNKKE
ncbi:AsmA family protein [Flavobacterium arcticum]|uniref:AsmA family protein n=1 Tax=Flavobacterium arcticum TaxID=1784713 RepID=A0A345HC67_9FLAO|nr:AsmA-like C-terminal region-containing protein [Flavobacterium arcticum]AXG74177.1 AsmA family protein [Flavobacterium arcticum]KAF2508235.1 AsmA family protein [Flavobacterium arcticum]